MDLTEVNYSLNETNQNGGHTMTKFEYENEVTRIEETKQSEWWKPVSGSHLVEIQEEPESYILEWEGREINKIRMPIKVLGKEYTWSITKGQTFRSLYGQLMLIGQDKGLLKGVTITLVVKGSGRDVDYTVLESVGLIPKPVVEEEVKG